MPAYLVAQLKIEDRGEYGTYEAGFLDIIKRYEGEILVVEESPSVLEGDCPFSRTVVLRFPDQDKAKQWWESPEYQALAEFRRRASTGNIILARGLR